MSYIQKNICMSSETLEKVVAFHKEQMDANAPYFVTRKQWETFNYLLMLGLNTHHQQGTAEEGCDDCKEHPGPIEAPQLDDGGSPEDQEDEEFAEQCSYETERNEGFELLAEHRQYWEQEMNDPEHGGGGTPLSEPLGSKLLKRLNQCGVESRDIQLITEVIRNLRPGIYRRELSKHEQVKLNHEQSSMILNPPGSTSEYHVRGYDLTVKIISRENVYF